MSGWLIALNWLTFAWLLGWAVRAMLDISSNCHRSISFPLLVFVVVYGLPIAFDLTRGVPDYHNTPGFRAGATDESVAVVYDLFVAACPVFWWMTARSRRRTGHHMVVLAGKKAQRALWLLLCSPLIALAFAPQPHVYLSYAAVLTENMSPAASEFHGIIGGLTTFSLVAGACLLLVRRNFSRALFLICPFMTVAVWLQGKRTAVALCLALIWAVAWVRGSLTYSRVIAFGALSLVALGSYITWYQLEFRPLSVADSYSVYENSRIDYGRDHNLKAAIFCELSDGNVRILEYRGQSLLFYLTMYVPRSLWPGKPWPYAIYITAHALQARPADRGWGLTTSLLDEAVANFGWVGLLVGPLIFALLCRICDHSSDPVVKTVGVLVACLLMTVEFVAFAPLVIGWLLYVGWSRHVSPDAPKRLRAVRPGPVQAGA